MPRVRAKERTEAPPTPTPLIGALLRLPHQAVVARIHAALATHGLELTPTELQVFLFPGPDGRRPIDLARQCAMTRQAMNYVLAGLERHGYVERHDAGAPNARVVRVTDLGRRVIQVIRGEVLEVEREWAAHLGARRFESLRDTLRELAAWLGKP